MERGLNIRYSQLESDIKGCLEKLLIKNGFQPNFQGIDVNSYIVQVIGELRENPNFVYNGLVNYAAQCVLKKIADSNP